MSAPRLLLFDLDGTLLTPERTILPENLRVLRALMERGVLVSLATGRPPSSARIMADVVEPNAPLICMNGAQVWDHRSGEVLLERTIPPSAASAVLERIAAMNVHANVYVGSEIWVRAWTAEAEASTKKDGVRPDVIPDLLARVADGARAVNKILLITAPERIDTLRAALEELDVDLVRSDLDYLEVLPRGVNKGEGAIALARTLGLDADADLMAFGDQGNDRELLEQAAVGVAMANADKALKAIADVVIGPNDEASIAAFLRQRYSLG